MHDKRYYWLKLEENYFDLKVQKALRKLPSGSDMLICYLKMQLKYLNKGGLIEFQGIYDDLAEEIALDIDEEVDLVKMTLGVLEKWRVIEPSDEGLFLTEMQGRIGSKTDSAIRMAKHREKQKMLQCCNNVQKSDPIKEIEIEKDIEIDIEKEIDNNNIEDTLYDFLQKNGFILSPLDYEVVGKWEDNSLTRHAIEEAVLNGKLSCKYVDAIIRNFKAKNIQTVNQAKDNSIAFKKNKAVLETQPSWLNEEVEANEATPEEIAEFERQLANL